MIIVISNFVCGNETDHRRRESDQCVEHTLAPMEHQPVIGTLEDGDHTEDDNAITLKTEWKRKGERVNFFTKEASNADFFDLVRCSALLGCFFFLLCPSRIPPPPIARMRTAVRHGWPGEGICAKQEESIVSFSWVFIIRGWDDSAESPSAIIERKNGHGRLAHKARGQRHYTELAPSLVCFDL